MYYIYIYIVYIHTCIYMDIYIYIIYIHTYVYMHIYIYIYKMVFAYIFYIRNSVFVYINYFRMKQSNTLDPRFNKVSFPFFNIKFK